MEKILRKIRNGVIKIFKWCYCIFLSFLPVKKQKIVFCNFNGNGYGCNPKYIAEELIRQNIESDLVWLLNDVKQNLPHQIRKVKYGSFKALYELATAKVWIFNTRNYKGIRKRKKQFYIQTWHGMVGIKQVEAKVEKYLSESYIKEAKYDGKITNLFLVNNTFTEELVKNTFWYDGEILNKGLPRNDIIHNPSTQLKEKVYKYFGISLDKKIVIYAPTFRKNESLDVYKFDYNRVISCLSRLSNSEYVMLVRLHPNVVAKSKGLEYTDTIINASEYSDIQELLAVSDVAITDYSSIMFDFSMYGKKVFIFAKDIEEYKKNERNFEFELEELPFPFAETEEKLCFNIEHFEERKYIEECEKFFDKIGLVKSSTASRDVVEILKKL